MNVNLLPTFTISIDDSFTVTSNGTVSAASVYIADGTGKSLLLNYNVRGYYLAELNYASGDVSADNGYSNLGGVVFSLPTATSVPEPMSLMLFAAGFSGVALTRCRRFLGV